MRVVFFKLAGAGILLGSLLAGWVWIDYRTFGDEPIAVSQGGLEYVVEPGVGLARVARDLEAKGVVRSARYFIWMARLERVESRMQAGTYRFNPGTTSRDLLHQLVEGRVVQYALTLVEGWTFQQVLEAVRRDPRLTHSIATNNAEAIMKQLGFSGVHPEGRFFPDTFHFPQGLSDVSFLRRAYRAMEERLAFEWEGRSSGLPVRKPYEALTLASIIEKETGLASERPEIAGVFVRRLIKGMRLQTDPTVIYGLGIGFDGNLRRRDLESASVYNTYRISGLPPTPIAMPGGDAIHAALHPAPGNALYFVARGDGSHHFSATLEEHNRAVLKFQLKRSGP